MEMWYGLKPVPPLWEFWEMDLLNVFSVGHVGEKGGTLASCSETKGEKERRSEILLEPVVSETEASTPSGLLSCLAATRLQPGHLHI